MSRLGDNYIDMDDAAECMRPGEIMLSPGVCGPDPRRPVDPYASSPPTRAIPVSTTKAPATSVSGAVKTKLSPQLLVLGAVSVAVIYFLGKQ